MKVLLRSVLLCLLTSSAIHADWRDQSSGATTTTPNIMGVDFVNASTGWMVGGTTSPVASFYSKTTDGGRNWKPRTLENVLVVLHDVDFVDEMHGWMVGESGSIFATVDGGKTWNQQSSGVGGVLYDIMMLDTLNGFVAQGGGASEGNGGAAVAGNVLITTNGGKNWTKATQPTGSSEYEIYSVYALSPSTLFCGTVIGIYKSIDAGITWTQATAKPQNFFVHSFYFFTPTVGIASGGSCAQGELHMYRTIDAGVTWDADTTNYGGTASDNQYNLYSISGIDDKNAWVVGNAGAILSTTNAGVSWTIESGLTSNDLIRVKFINKGRGWAVGLSNTVGEYFLDTYKMATDSTILNYGIVSDTTPVTKTFTVSNPGTTPINVTIRKSGTAFTLPGAPSFSLAGGASKAVDVVYHPSDSISQGTVYVESESQNSALRVALIGRNHTVGVNDITVPSKELFLAQNYPNPFTGETTVHVNGSAGAEFTVMDVFGRTAFSEHVAGGETTITLNARQLAPGIYFYSLRSDRGASLVRSMTKIQ